MRERSELSVQNGASGDCSLRSQIKLLTSKNTDFENRAESFILQLCERSELHFHKKMYLNFRAKIQHCADKFVKMVKFEIHEKVGNNPTTYRLLGPRSAIACSRSIRLTVFKGFLSKKCKTKKSFILHHNTFRGLRGN